MAHPVSELFCSEIVRELQVTSVDNAMELMWLSTLKLFFLKTISGQSSHAFANESTRGPGRNRGGVRVRL